MQDLVPFVSTAITVIALVYFLLEFQFTAARDRLTARLLSFVKR